ncbi:MAG: hypothetical protein V8S98_05605 [Lachnospiraceae bacterium]
MTYPQLLRRLLRSIKKRDNAEIITVIANVADREQMDAAAAKGVEKFGEINVACCNASAMPSGSICGDR